MGTKTISIMDDVHKLLESMKAPGESFSDELRRLAKDKCNIMEFSGAWKNITEEESRKIKSQILESRKGTRIEDIKTRLKQ